MSLRKQEDERLALRSQMSVEERERQRIEDIKAAEKEKAEVRYVWSIVSRDPTLLCSYLLCRPLQNAATAATLVVRSGNS